MTDQEIRIAVAEACRWQWKRGGTIPFGCDRPPPCWHSPDGFPSKSIPPDYPNDLNAMHEAEITLTPHFTNQDDSWDKYTSYLDTIAGPGMAVIATARQRAEAFLRTTGKWNETP